MDHVKTHKHIPVLHVYLVMRLCRFQTPRLYCFFSYLLMIYGCMFGCLQNCLNGSCNYIHTHTIVVSLITCLWFMDVYLLIYNFVVFVVWTYFGYWSEDTSKASRLCICWGTTTQSYFL